MAKKTKGDVAAQEAPKTVELVELKAKAKFKMFRPRFQVNADKLELVFEVSWDHMPSGMMERIHSVAQKFGDLTFTELAVQADPPKTKPVPAGTRDLPGLGKQSESVPQGGEEIK